MIRELMNAYASENPEAIRQAEEKLAGIECHEPATAAVKLCSVMHAVDDLASWAPPSAAPGVARARACLATVIAFLSAGSPEAEEAAREAKALFG